MLRRSLPLLLFLASLAVAAALVLTGGGADGPGAPEERPGGAPHPAPEAPERAALDGVTSSGAPARVAEPPAPAPSAPRAADGAADVAVAGTIVVRSSRGERFPREDGWVEFDVEGERRRVRAEVGDGRFRFRVPRGRTIRPDQVELGGRLTFLRAREEVRADDDRTLALEAVWPPGALLHVEDAVTREGLDDVTVLRSTSAIEPERIRPPLDGEGTRAIARDARSPIELLRQAFGWSHLWVGAPGYAWSHLSVDETSDGERTVRLARGGALRIHVVRPAGAWADAETRLRLRTAAALDGPPAFDAPVRSSTETVEVDALPAGPYAVTLEVGRTDRSSFSIGRVDVLVVAAATVDATLVVAAAPDPEAPLAGILELPPRWFESPPVRPRQLVLRREGEEEVRARREATLLLRNLETVDARRGTHRFDAGTLAPGTYVWGVDETGYEGTVVLPPEGRTDARLVVPPPTELIVRCVERGTGVPVDVNDVTWRPVLAVGDRRTLGSFEWRHVDPARSTHALLVPPGVVLLTSFSRPPYGLATKTVQVPRAARHEVDLEVPRALRLHLSLRCGETSVPLDGTLEVRVERVEGGGRPRASSTNGVGKTYYLDGPGRYVVDVGRIVGFLDPAPVEVHVEGESSELVVPLVAE